MQELTGSQLYNNYTIRCLLYYSLRRREPTTDEREIKYDDGMQHFLLKLGFLLKRNRLHKEKY